MQVAEYVADMMALEGQVQGLLADVGVDVRSHPGAEAALRRFRGVVEEHRAALKARLSALGGGEVTDPARLLPLAGSSESRETERVAIPSLVRSMPGNRPSPISPWGTQSSTPWLTASSTAKRRGTPPISPRNTSVGTRPPLRRSTN